MPLPILLPPARSGQCTQREAVQIAGRCPPNNPIAPEPFTNCLVDPCQFAPRCPTPNVTCVSRYCPGFFRCVLRNRQRFTRARW